MGIKVPSQAKQFAGFRKNAAFVDSKEKKTIGVIRNGTQKT